MMPKILNILVLYIFAKVFKSSCRLMKININIYQG